MGKLIVIEGTDGSGKSTQFRKLWEHLEADCLSAYCISPLSGREFRVDPDVSGRPVWQ